MMVTPKQFKFKQPNKSGVTNTHQATAVITAPIKEENSETGPSISPKQRGHSLGTTAMGTVSKNSSMLAE